ncbi:MAG: homoserine dehydrogenase [Chloroflexota bacterium]|nr:homoserine dehydrogenase [Chloroflexota bacterium]
MARLRIGLIGWGTVGSALGRLVAAGPLPLELALVAVRDRTRERGVGLPAGATIVEPAEVAGAELDAVVELAGGLEGPRSWAQQALGRGTPYVTANKALLATHGDELARVARTNGAALLGSASVGGGVPMIETVSHLAATGAISRVRGVLNATTTSILSAMGGGRTYGDALREAQEAGYAEADPSFDVDGHDAAQKLAILAGVAWGAFRRESEVDLGGIRGFEVREGQIVRLVADATEDKLRVAPLELEPNSAMGRTAGIECVLEIDVRAAGAFTVSGPGAGGRVTAGAVYADLARLVAGERPILFGGAA